MKNAWLQRRIRAYYESSPHDKRVTFIPSIRLSDRSRSIMGSHFIAAGVALCRQAPDPALFFTDTWAMSVEHDDDEAVQGLSTRLAVIFRKVSTSGRVVVLGTNPPRARRAQRTRRPSPRTSRPRTPRRPTSTSSSGQCRRDTTISTTPRIPLSTKSHRLGPREGVNDIVDSTSTAHPRPRARPCAPGLVS